MAAIDCDAIALSDGGCAVHTGRHEVRNVQVRSATGCHPKPTPSPSDCTGNRSSNRALGLLPSHTDYPFGRWPTRSSERP
jgi:hypothetical protein